MDNGASSYRRFLDGDDNGFAEIVRDYKDGLILYLNGVVGNFSLAEELMEETFFKIITRKPKYRPTHSFKAWLYTIGRNVALDHLRRHGREEALDHRELGDELDLERLYILEERKLTLHRALKKLHPDYRQALWLLYFEGLSHAEAAAVMKKSDRQMKNLVYRGKIALKSELSKEGFTDEEL